VQHWQVPFHHVQKVRKRPCAQYQQALHRDRPRSAQRPRFRRALPQQLTPHLFHKRHYIRRLVHLPFRQPLLQLPCQGRVSVACPPQKKEITLETLRKHSLSRIDCELNVPPDSYSNSYPGASAGITSASGACIPSGNVFRIRS
jgi:hypothetical protein